MFSHRALAVATWLCGCQSGLNTVAANVNIWHTVSRIWKYVHTLLYLNFKACLSQLITRCIYTFRARPHKLDFGVILCHLLNDVLPPPQNVGGGYNGFALSPPSVRPSVRPSLLSCPLYKSYTIEGFSQTWLKCSPNKRMCRTHVAHVSAQGQGHNWGQNIKQSNVRHYVVSAL